MNIQFNPEVTMDLAPGARVVILAGLPVEAPRITHGWRQCRGG